MSKDTQSGLSRRHLFTGTTALVAATSLSACGGDEEAPLIIRPDGVPMSNFGKESTAEEVTAGLDLSGKTAVITGCNSGLGYETMRVLASRGAHVFGVARSMEKATDACNSVVGTTTPFSGDLEQFETMAVCADAIGATGAPIDMLILNAGVMALPELQQVNGIERHFVINHLGHFILANRLMEQVKSAPQGRFVTVGSQGYMWAPDTGIQFDNLDGAWGEYVPNTAYGHSKLANGLFSLELARRLGESTATANVIHPGVINTNLGRHYPSYIRIFANLFSWALPFFKTVEAGAATETYAATAPGLSEISGFYFEDCNPVVAGQNMENAAMAERLWTVSEGLTQPYLVSSASVVDTDISAPRTWAEPMPSGAAPFRK
jgi:NAD(P)-dependent dehydrogenase (short-subunit alcohol dehydrogenase family)